MTRGRYYTTVMPIAGILYALALVVIQSGSVALVGAMVFALLGVIGIVAIRPS